MMKSERVIKMYAVSVFLIVFLFINGIAHAQVLRHENEQKMKASYTAKSTVKRIQAQLDRYLTKSDILKQTIELGYDMDDERFSMLAEVMRDDGEVIKEIDLAKDGIISQVYPSEKNEAMGINMFEYEGSSENAKIAMESHKYAIAGPFEGVGDKREVLLFDPVYITDEEGREEFWGFSVLTIDWNKFIGELELDKLEDTSYQYKIWKKDAASGDKTILAQGMEQKMQEPIVVECSMPNDIWYFEISQNEGWFSVDQLVANSILCVILSLLGAMVYLQYATRHMRAVMYTKEIEKSANAAKAANVAKTGFLSRMSHDIRTPLNGIIGLLKIDEKHKNDVELLERNRKKMLVSANHLLSLINDVLQMSKLENGEVTLSHEVIEFNKFSKDIMTIIGQRAVEKRITMEYDVTPDKIEEPFVYGSTLHLRQIFLNIYGNCIKYNHDGGKVRTEFESLGKTDGMITYKWIISDNGIGMSQDFVEHIFEPFAQEHSDARSVYNGTGLGMPIAKTLVEKMNGYINVESKEGVGTKFTIIIPFEIAGKEEVFDMDEEEIQKGSIRGYNLLLAEDNKLNAEIAQILLADVGADVVTVHDGKEAKEQFENNPPGTFDAILMDVMMPVVDGITATKMIRAMERDDAHSIPIIAVTANAFDEDAKKCIDAGMNAHIAKPIDVNKMVNVISELVG